MEAMIELMERPVDLNDREYRFAISQYVLYAERVTELQKEREVWIRHSIVATFAFFGWIAVYRDNVTDTFMLEMFQLQAVYLTPVVFNLGGALRFFFIQRDINRLGDFLVDMERDVLQLPDAVLNGPAGRGIRDRHWHAPSICYWLAITGFSAVAAGVLSL